MLKHLICSAWYWTQKYPRNRKKSVVDIKVKEGFSKFRKVKEAGFVFLRKQVTSRPPSEAKEFERTEWEITTYPTSCGHRKKGITEWNMSRNSETSSPIEIGVKFIYTDWKSLKKKKMLWTAVRLMQTVWKLVRKLSKELLCKNAATVKGGNVSFWGTATAEILILSIICNQIPHMPLSYSGYVKDWGSTTRYTLKITDDREGLRYFWKFIEWMEEKRQERKRWRRETKKAAHPCPPEVTPCSGPLAEMSEWTFSTTPGTGQDKGSSGMEGMSSAPQSSQRVLCHAHHWLGAAPDSA